MRIMSWNCRGLGNPLTVRELCRLVKQKRPVMVFLMETKIRKSKMEIIRCKLHFENMFVVDSMGKSGGMALIWGEEVSVRVQNFSHRHIGGLVSMPGLDEE
jgi:exonuclease III